MVDRVVVISSDEYDGEGSTGAPQSNTGNSPAEDLLSKIIRSLRRCCGAKEEELSLARAKFSLLEVERRSSDEFLSKLEALSAKVSTSDGQTDCVLELLDLLTDGESNDVPEPPQVQFAAEADGESNDVPEPAQVQLATEAVSSNANDTTAPECDREVEDMPGPSNASQERRGRKRKYTDDAGENSVRIRLLEKKIRKLDRDIRKLDEAEVGLDDLESEHGAYLLQDKLKRQLLKSWENLCKLRGESAEFDMVKPRIEFSGTPHARLNKVLVKFARRCVDFPSVDDFRHVLDKACGKFGLSLNETELNQYACLALSTIGEQLQRHRRKTFWDDHGSWVTDQVIHGSEEGRAMSDPADGDETLKAQLQQNYQLSKSQMDKLLNSYVEMSCQAEIPVENPADNSAENPLDNLAENPPDGSCIDVQVGTSDTEECEDDEDDDDDGEDEKDEDERAVGDVESGEDGDRTENPAPGGEEDTGQITDDSENEIVIEFEDVDSASDADSESEGSDQEGVEAEGASESVAKRPFQPDRSDLAPTASRSVIEISDGDSDPSS